MGRASFFRKAPGAGRSKCFFLARGRHTVHAIPPPHRTRGGPGESPENNRRAGRFPRRAPPPPLPGRCTTMTMRKAACPAPRFPAKSLVPARKRFVTGVAPGLQNQCAGSSPQVGSTPIRFRQKNQKPRHAGLFFWLPQRAHGYSRSSRSKLMGTSFAAPPTAVRAFPSRTPPVPAVATSPAALEPIPAKVLERPARTSVAAPSTIS